MFSSARKSAEDGRKWAQRGAEEGVAIVNVLCFVAWLVWEDKEQKEKGRKELEMFQEAGRTLAVLGKW